MAHWYPGSPLFHTPMSQDVRRPSPPPPQYGAYPNGTVCPAFSYNWPPPNAPPTNAALMETWREVERLKAFAEKEREMREREHLELRRRVTDLEREVGGLRAALARYGSVNATPIDGATDPLSRSEPGPCSEVKEHDDDDDVEELVADFYYGVTVGDAEPATPQEAREPQTSKVEEENLYLFGGVSPGNQPRRTVEKFDAESGYWAEVGALPEELEPLHLSAVGLSHQTAFLFSAFPSAEGKNCVYRYIASDEESWTRVPAAHSGRCLAAYARLGDAICSVGGYSSHRPSIFPFPPDLTGMDVVSTVEKFDPGSESWTYLPSLRDARIRCALVSESPHVVYAIGGLAFRGGRALCPTSSVERLDTRQGMWTPVTGMLHRRAFLGAVLTDPCSISALGGINASVSDSPALDTSASGSVESYQTRMNAWVPLQNMPSCRCLFTCHMTDPDRLYVLGGQTRLSRNAQSLQPAGMDVFAREEQKWIGRSMLAGVTSRRSAHAACVL